MCSLVKRQVGRAAREGLRLSAPSRAFADAETPMHAMMEPAQVLEHARARPKRRAPHRFCMVHPGPGGSPGATFEKYLEGVRLVSQHTNLKRCRRSIGHMVRGAAARGALREGRQSQRRAPQRRDLDELLRRGHHDRSATRGRPAHDPGPSRRPASRTCVGGILNLGERPASRRVEMAFRAGGDQPDERSHQTCSIRGPARSSAIAMFMDPWEAVKWIAIFRLDPAPRLCFRLCGGRVENLGEPAAARRPRGDQRRDDGQTS